MSSSSSKNRLRLAKEIQSLGRPVELACDHCFWNNLSCIAMEGASRLRCSECVRRGRKCVNLSWESLDKTREEYRAKVEKDESDLAEVLARLMRDKKILKQAEERAKKKALCLASEIEESGEFAEEQDCPAADACVGISPAVWSSIDFVNQSIDTVGFSVADLPPLDSGGTASAAGGSS